MSITQNESFQPSRLLDDLDYVVSALLFLDLTLLGRLSLQLSKSSNLAFVHQQ